MNVNIKKNIFRISSPLLKHKKKLLVLAAMVAVAIILYNVFSNPKQQAPSLIEKDNATLFLENVMIREYGLFTLLGSKPMLLFDITSKLLETEEELEHEYKAIKDFLEKNKHNPDHASSYAIFYATFPGFEEFKEQSLKSLPKRSFGQRKKIWEQWFREKGCLSNSIYKLTFRKDDGLFINIPNVVYILKKHYSDFVDLTGMTFDPGTILDSIEDAESPFWGQVFKNHYLLGLILGYGQKNAFLFDWKCRHSFSIDTVSIERFRELARLRHRTKAMRKANILVEDLEIPYFVVFDIDDKEMVRYSHEREKIIDFLKDKELVPFVLSQLE